MAEINTNNMNWKKIISWSVVGALCSLLIGFGICLAVFFQHYSDPKSGISLFYPRGWSVITKMTPGGIVGFASPQENKMDMFADGISITYVPFPGKSLTLMQYVEQTKKQMAGLFGDMTLDESFPALIGFHLGNKVVFHSSGDMGATLIMYSVVGDKEAYNITYFGMSDRYKKSNDRYLVGVSALTFQFNSHRDE